MTPEYVSSGSRADLHCHSTASQISKLGVQRTAGLPECATPPEEVYELAKRRGMDFVTITEVEATRSAGPISTARAPSRASSAARAPPAAWPSTAATSTGRTQARIRSAAPTIGVRAPIRASSARVSHKGPSREPLVRALRPAQSAATSRLSSCRPSG